jgi:hypothetical protein
MWKEAITALFEALFKALSVGTEKSIKHFDSDSRFPGRNTNQGPTEYEAGVLPT